jgi:isopentenyl-diphosphate Delta-isomerase
MCCNVWCENPRRRGDGHTVVVQRPDDGSGADPAEVVAVDGAGHTLGPVGRDAAHAAPGVRHRAVSVQVVTADGRWLLQRRADGKALFGGGWSNSCCTHPQPGETTASAARRRVAEELGLVLDELRPAGTFEYRAVDPGSGLVEHEVDDVFVAPVAGTGDVVPDPVEIAEVAWLDHDEAAALLARAGTPWAATVLRYARDALAAT